MFRSAAREISTCWLFRNIYLARLFKNKREGKQINNFSFRRSNQASDIILVSRGPSRTARSPPVCLPFYERTKILRTYTRARQHRRSIPKAMELKLEWNFATVFRGRFDRSRNSIEDEKRNERRRKKKRQLEVKSRWGNVLGRCASRGWRLISSSKSSSIISRKFVESNLWHDSKFKLAIISSSSWLTCLPGS